MDPETVGTIVNIGVFAATAAAAGVAWYQAAGARKAQGKAEDAQLRALASQRAAAASQKQAADALTDQSATAKRAHDLEARREARAAEFRDVAWQGKWDYDGNDPVFRVSNTGLTVAEHVTAVVTRPDRHRVSGKLGTVQPGDSVTFHAGAETTDAFTLLLFTDSPFSVHWVSPLGEPGTYDYVPLAEE